jgi:geranylgeranyl diphosphate synthase type II
VSATASPPIPTTVEAVTARVGARLSERLSTIDLPAPLAEAIAYASSGGKMLRPALTILSCQAAGAEGEMAATPAMALELIHAFSLVHDDLPAMDDDDLRRGRPTLHRHAGEAMAILAGDAMLSLAFQVLADDETLGARPAVVAALVRELSRATTAMIAGQVYDTLGGFPDGLDESARLHLVHRNKTGALLRCACRMGAIAADAPESVLTALTTYGEAIGLMFQIVDDLLDVTQSTEHLGKTAGKDLEAGKITFPGVLGVSRSRLEVERQQSRANAALGQLGETARPLIEICDFLAVRTR